MHIFDRAKQLLGTEHFSNPGNPIDFGPIDITPPQEDQYILRMMVKTPDSNFRIPSKLEWLYSTIKHCNSIQKLMGITNSFVYVTVRHGTVVSTTDDEWHVDGFSMRVPHPPEQNYIFTSVNGIEYLTDGFDIPSDFNPLVHNIHKYFQKYIGSKTIHVAPTNRLLCIDPYIVHRRPPLTYGTKRAFFRISFVPIEIEDDTCELNPLFPVKYYNREDIRKTLLEY